MSEAGAAVSARDAAAKGASLHPVPAGRVGPKLALLGAAIGLAAVNTGNNILYLILSLVMALTCLSWIASSWSLRRLKVSALLPEEVVRGEPFLVGVEATGRFPLLPQTWLEVTLAGLPDPVELTVAVPSQRGRGVASARTLVHRRGVYTGLTLSAATGYPLDLWLRRARPVAWQGRVVVLPRYRRIESLRTARTRRASCGVDAPSARGGRRGADLHDIRPYTSSDDARQIEWRSTARAGRLMVKRLEQEQERRIDLVLDLEAGNDAAFEEAVERCAAILDLARRERFDVRLLLPCAEAPLTGGDAMRALAEVRPAAPGTAGPAREGLAAAIRRARASAELVVISAEPGRATPVELA